MSLTDPVADMLTRIRNACSAGHRRVDMPVSQAEDRDRPAAAGQPLHRATSRSWTTAAHGVLRLYLKYHNEPPVIRELRRVSTPGPPAVREVPRAAPGAGTDSGMAIVSTPKGLMTDREARSANLGGELLAVVW